MMHIPSQSCTLRHHVGAFKLAVAGVFTLWKSTNTTAEPLHVWGAVPQHTMLSPQRRALGLGWDPARDSC